MKAIVISARPSNSAKALSDKLTELGIDCRARNGNGNYRRNTVPVDAVVNWGCGSEDRLLGNTKVNQSTLCGTYNYPQNVARTSNKLAAFKIWERADAGIPIPAFTESMLVAQTWTRHGVRVFCRTTLNGNSGDGIVVASTPEEVVPAPLYTAEVSKRHEFRLHVVNGRVIDGVRKAFRQDVPEDERDKTIMNHAAGTIFVRSGTALQRASENRNGILDQAINAVSSLGLSFGAVDIMTTDDNRPIVLEVNTACGLEGTTLDRYGRAFFQMLNNQPITPWDFTEFEANPTTESN